MSGDARAAAAVALVFPDVGAVERIDERWTETESWQETEEVLAPLGVDLHDAVVSPEAPGDPSPHRALAVGLLLAREVERHGLRPAAVLGHGAGEHTALAAVGGLELEAAVEVHAEHARWSRPRESTGAATVFGVDDVVVERICGRGDGRSWVSCHAAPRLSEVRGLADSLLGVAHACAEQGAAHVDVVAGSPPRNTPLASDLGERVGRTIDAAVGDIATPLVAAVDGGARARAAALCEALAAGITAPVRWPRAVASAERLGVTTIVELGVSAATAARTRASTTTAAVVRVCTPEDVDALVRLSQLLEPQGEAVSILERVVVSPAAGIFEPSEGLDDLVGHRIRAGEVIGRVAGAAVVCPFDGELVAVEAGAGERLQPSQRVAWLREGPPRARPRGRAAVAAT